MVAGLEHAEFTLKEVCPIVYKDSGNRKRFGILN